MKNSIDGSVIAAEVRLLRQVKKKSSFLLVEGINDIKVLRGFISKDNCELVNAHEKQNVIDAIHILEDDGCLGTCGVIDPDYDSILGISYDSENVIDVSHHDLDVLIFMSMALEKYISIMADDNLVNVFQRNQGMSVREFILNTAAVVGSSRLASAARDLKIYFKDLSLFDFIDENNLAVSDDIFSHLVERSKHPKCNVRQLKALTKENMEANYEKSVICQGHDIAQILGIALRRAISNRKGPQTYGSEVEKGLRLAFDWECFEQTVLFERMSRWEELNRPWQILRRKR